MSLHSPSVYCLPDQTARVARAAFPRGNPYLRMHDVLGTIFTNPEFADLAALQRAILLFIAEWNQIAHPFRWTAASFAKILAKVDDALAAEHACLVEAA